MHEFQNILEKKNMQFFSTVNYFLKNVEHEIEYLLF